MELQAEEALGLVLDGGVRAVGRACDGSETLGQLGQLVPVGVPDFQRVSQPLKERAFRKDLQRAHPVFTAFRVFDLASQVVPHELHSVADSQHGNAQFEKLCGRVGRLLAVDAGGPSGQDDCPRRKLFDLFDADVEGNNLRVDLAFADPAGDDLRVLGAEVENEQAAVDGWGRGGGHEKKTARNRGALYTVPRWEVELGKQGRATLQSL